MAGHIIKVKDEMFEFNNKIGNMRIDFLGNELFKILSDAKLIEKVFDDDLEKYVYWVNARKALEAGHGIKCPKGLVYAASAKNPGKFVLYDSTIAGKNVLGYFDSIDELEAFAKNNNAVLDKINELEAFVSSSANKEA